MNRKLNIIYTSFRFGLIFILFTILLCHSLTAQDRVVNRGNQQWFQYYSTTDLKGSWSLLVDGGLRWRDRFNQKSQYIIRGAIAYKVSDKLRAAAGFGHLGFYNGADVFRKEYRPYQELQFQHQLKPLIISHRLRTEERIYDNSGVIIQERRPSNFVLRIRYGISASFEVLSISENSKILLTLGNEIFINALSDGPRQKFFAQNRFTISPTLQLNQNLDFAFTWNKQFASTSAENTFNFNNVLWLQIKHHLSFGKNEESN